MAGTRLVVVGTVIQDALFGDPKQIIETTRPRVSTQDPELVASVVRQAEDPGYRIVEKSQRVFRVDPAHKGAVEPVPAYEAQTVLQLLDARVLDWGGNHTIQVGDTIGPSRSVLVPKDTHHRVVRWAHLRPLHTGRPSTTAPDSTCGPITVRASENGHSLITCQQFTGSVRRAPGTTEARYRYRVCSNAGQQIGHASSREAGARLLARYHGWVPGPVRTDR